MRHHSESAAPGETGCVPGPTAEAAPAWTRLLSRLIGPLCVLAAGVILAWWSWGAWCDVLIDFGRELYIPWQLARGSWLHRDVVPLFGPLSPFFNSIVFRLFGANLAVLVGANLALLTCFTALLYRLLLLLAGRLSATVGSCLFLALFAFGHHLPVGNYNFVCPYAHEMTHGILLGLLTFFGLARYLDRGRARDLFWTGLGAGAVFLTKSEIFLALALALLVVFILLPATARAAGRRGCRPAAALLLGAAIPPLLAFFLLRRGLPTDVAALGVLGSWPGTLDDQVTQLEFYRRGMGLDDVGGNLLRMLRAAGLWLLPVAAALAGGILVGRLGLRRVWLPPAVCASFAALLAIALPRAAWIDIARPLPLLAGLTCLALLGRWWRDRRDRRLGGFRLLQLALAAFALALLGKMLLNARIFHYGFVLALPATVLLVLLLLDWLPRAAERLGADARVLRAGALGTLVAFSAFYLSLSQANLRGKTHRVTGAEESFFADARAAVAQPAIDLLSERMGPEDTLAVLPEGVMLNFLLRRDNPTPFIGYLPPDLLLVGEERVRAAFAESAPDYIVLVARSTAEYGYAGFGEGYGEPLLDWIRQHYRPTERIAPPGLQGVSFGSLVILERR